MIETPYEGYIVLAAGSEGPFTLADREIDDTGRIVADHPLGTFKERSTAQTAAKALNHLATLDDGERGALMKCVTDNLRNLPSIEPEEPEEPQPAVIPPPQPAVEEAKKKSRKKATKKQSDGE